MSTLLISMLGGADGDARHARFRLPGGERIVETSFLGIELARALQCDKLHIVGTPDAHFDRLLELLPNSEREAPVKETAPTGTKPEAEAKSAPAEEAKDADALAEAPTEAQPADDARSDATPEDAGSDDAPAAGTDAESGDAPAEEASAPEEASDASDEAAEESPAEDAAPEVAADAPAEEPTAGADAPAPADETPAPTETRVPVKHHEPDLRSLGDRIQSQVQSKRPDRDAMAALAERLQAALGIKEVHCELISNATEGRSFMAAVRSIAELPKKGDTVHLDVTCGSRAFPMLGILAMHYFRTFRPEVKPGHVYEGVTEGSGADKVHPVVALDGPLEFMDWMAAFRDVRDGRAPQALQGLFNNDRRLQRMAGPYVRYQRGVQFGAMSEVVEGARLIEERRKRLNRLPYAHPFRLFDKVLGRSLQPFVKDGSASQRQLVLSERALAGGNISQAALHLREALVSSCLEVYKRNPTRAWIDVPQSGGAQQVRPRDVAAYILSTDAAKNRAPNLGTVWPLLSTARNRYVNTSPTTVPASHLKDQDHEIHRSIELARAVIAENQLDGIAEEVVWDEAVKQGIDLRVLRAREGRRPRRGGKTGKGEKGDRPQRGRRTRGDGDGPRGEGGGSGGGRGPRGEGGGGRGPRGEGGGRGPRGGGRGPRRDGDRPPRRDGGGGRPDPADSTPRVTTSRGLGNLGKVLADAGLGADEGGKKKKKKDRDETAAPQASAPESTPPTPAPEPPAPEAPESPEPPKSDPTFDVAGPGDPPPAE